MAATQSERLSALNARPRQHSQARKSRTAQIAEAVDLQSSIHKAVIALSKDVDTAESAKVRASVVASMSSGLKGWQTITDQLMALRGQSKPGVTRPDLQPKKPRRAPTPDFAPESMPEEDGQTGTSGNTGI